MQSMKLAPRPASRKQPLVNEATDLPLFVELTNARGRHVRLVTVLIAAIRNSFPRDFNAWRITVTHWR